MKPDTPTNPAAGLTLPMIDVTFAASVTEPLPPRRLSGVLTHPHQPSLRICSDGVSGQKHLCATGEWSDFHDLDLPGWA